MSVNVNDLSITSLETIMAFGINGGAFKFMLDELQNGTISNTQDNTALTGKAGRTIGMLKRNKAVTVSGTNGMVSMGLIEAEVGYEGQHLTATAVKWPDYLTVNSNSATTTYKAIGTAGNEIGEVIVKDSDGTIVKRLTQDSAASTGKFAYDPSTKALTFYSGEIANNTSIVVYYYRNIEGDVISNMSDNYSETLELFVDALAEDKCHNIYHVQFYIPYADFTGAFDLAMGDSQTTHGFEATSLASACNAGGTKYWDMTVFGNDAPDAPALSSIAITTAPTKTSYTAGEAFNSTGMVVTATYNDGATKAVTGYTFAPLGALTTSNTSITITYIENGVTKTATQAITVTA